MVVFVGIVVVVVVVVGEVTVFALCVVRGAVSIILFVEGRLVHIW